MKIFLKILILNFFIAFVANLSYADFIDNDVADAYAEFIEILNKNISGVKNNGKLCIYGSDEISNAIIFRNNDYLEIEDDLKNIERCGFAYIALNKKKSFRFLSNKFIENNVLTFANYNDFTITDNGIIEIQLGRRNFELIINKKQLKSGNFKLNPLINSLVIN